MEGFKDFTVFVVYSVPTLLTLGVIAGAVVIIVKLAKKKRNKKKEINL